ncbi:MAG: endonuclease domain-containing protein [Planctomycetes bacterium]|nr:endonuclease domain-containing protein [Planctomycetota bacterium]
MRREATTPERLLWSRLRYGQLGDIKFRRQVAIGRYFVDFYCHEARLAIELDGDSHIGKAAYDQQRTAALEAQGIQVLRVANDDVLRTLDTVVEGILLACGRHVDGPRGSSSGG